MKQLLCFSVLIFVHTAAFCQANGIMPSGAHLKVYDLEVTHNKTTSLVFPEDVISADVGSIGVIAEKFDKASNIIRVKANRPNFQETSLTVVTGEGKLWTFVVRYTERPRYLSVDMNNADALVYPPLSQAQSSLYPMPVPPLSGPDSLQLSFPGPHRGIPPLACPDQRTSRAVHRLLASARKKPGAEPAPH